MTTPSVVLSAIESGTEEGVESALRDGRAKRWQEENAAAFEAWNAYVEKHGVPLAKYRNF